MKKIVLLLLTLVSFSVSAQEKKEIKDQVVEASCGQCNFGMTSKKGCDLAVKIDGHSYFVEGTKIDQHGDAHAENGFCNAVRKAKVSGEIKNDKFIATDFALVDEKTKK
ncbi:DUF6370 family protein [Flavobacterium terrae]|uniref:Glutaminyl-tRNA synthetase n=1 Tax=Flavobacterium terrae TaxID=415425 RepID=A0A1M6DU70_9FLAO|nr:DUF6370 family protein [Flavobacterium terrae]SHI76679.1 hypothetical protein SAMN05444363_1632 [Flavobacterium terrae]